MCVQCTSVCPSVDNYACVCLSVCLPACLSACLPACLPACLYACMPVCLYACMPDCMYDKYRSVQVTPGTEINTTSIIITIADSASVVWPPAVHQRNCQPNTRQGTAGDTHTVGEPSKSHRVNGSKHKHGSVGLPLHKLQLARANVKLLSRSCDCPQVFDV